MIFDMKRQGPAETANDTADAAGAGVIAGGVALAPPA